MKTYIVVGLIAVLVVGGFLYTQNKDQTQSPVQENNQLQEKSEVELKDGKFEGSIEELSRSGGSYKCLVSSDTNGIISNGTVYVSGERIRTDFESAVPSYGKVMTYMIADATDVYSWTSMMPEGFKMKKTTSAESESQTNSAVQPFDINHKQSYSCEAVQISESQFEVPANITFKII